MTTETGTKRNLSRCNSFLLKWEEKRSGGTQAFVCRPLRHGPTSRVPLCSAGGSGRKLWVRLYRLVRSESDQRLMFDPCLRKDKSDRGRSSERQNLKLSGGKKTPFWNIFSFLKLWADAQRYQTAYGSGSMLKAMSRESFGSDWEDSAHWWPGPHQRG